MLCVIEVKTPSPVKYNQWNTADVAYSARNRTRLIIMYNLTRSNSKVQKKTCFKQKSPFALHLIKLQSRRNNCDIISHKSCLLASVPAFVYFLFVCCCFFYSKLFLSYSTSKWSSTCPSTSCRLTCGRKSTITMNIATRERSSTRTASLTSWTTRSKRWDSNTW